MKLCMDSISFGDFVKMTTYVVPKHAVLPFTTTNSGGLHVLFHKRCVIEQTMLGRKSTGVQ